MKGETAMAEGWREFLTAWVGYTVQADEYRDLDDERVLVLLHAGGQGKMSGVELGLTREREEPTCSQSRTAR